MLKKIGDALPDDTDDCRFNLIKHRVPYYQRITEECDLCGGSGKVNKTTAAGTKSNETRDCSCKKSLALVIELLKSNFPQQMLGISNEKFFPRQYVELDIKTQKKIGKPRDFMEHFVRPYLDNKVRMLKNSCSFLLYGNNESGKTYGGLYMMHEMVRAGISAHYLRFKNYMNLLNSSYQNMDDRKVLRQIRDVKFLLIDELGKEHGKGEYNMAELEELIKYRQDNMSTTGLITNVDYEEFVKVYGNHVHSTFNKSFKVLLMNPDGQFRSRTRVDWEKS